MRSALIFLAAALGQASPGPEQVLAKADAAFARGIEQRTSILVARKHFVEAADGYRELHRRGVRSTALYRKLGDALALAERWPEAIWAYQLGLKLDPNDAGLREHLAFLRAKVLYTPTNLGRPEADVWPEPLPRPSEYEFILISGIAYVLACLLTAIGWQRGSLRTLLFALILLLIAIAAGAGAWHTSQQAARDRDTPLTIVTHNTSFHRGNSTNYPQHPILPVLPRGMEVRRLHTRGSWLQVRLSTGEVGWIPASAALVVQ